MGREIRKVPPDWEHPKNKNGYHRPLKDHFEATLREWNENNAKWEQGLCRNWDIDDEKDARAWEHIPDKYKHMTYAEYDVPQPKAEDYMPDWPEHERTHLQMYETCTEGTPISPVMKTPEELARWLADNDASAFGSDTASYEGWLRVCKGGVVCGAVGIPGVGLVSGVEALKDHEDT
jgi:hypothetical protein